MSNNNNEEIDYFFAEFDYLLQNGRDPKKALLETAEDYAYVFHDIKPVKNKKSNFFMRLLIFLRRFFI